MVIVTILSSLCQFVALHHDPVLDVGGGGLHNEVHNDVQHFVTKFTVGQVVLQIQMEVLKHGKQKVNPTVALRNDGRRAQK